MSGYINLRGEGVPSGWYLSLSLHQTPAGKGGEWTSQTILLHIKVLTAPPKIVLSHLIILFLPKSWFCGFLSNH